MFVQATCNLPGTQEKTKVTLMLSGTELLHTATCSPLAPAGGNRRDRGSLFGSLSSGSTPPQPNQLPVTTSGKCLPFIVPSVRGFVDMLPGNYIDHLTNGPKRLGVIRGSSFSGDRRQGENIFWLIR